MKKCPRCTEIKQYTGFNKNKQEKDGYNGYCKLCQKELKLLLRYKIDLSEVNRLKELQENKCKICDKEEKLVVDHCHETGKVRGLLCTKCNKGLGHFKDNINLFKKCIEYIGENSVSKNLIFTE